MSLLRKGNIGLKPCYIGIFNANLKHGVSVNIVKYLANMDDQPARMSNTDGDY
mgnify:CR=1 FL=1